MRNVAEEYPQWDSTDCPCQCRGDFVMHERRRLRALSDEEYAAFISKIERQIEEMKLKNS